MSLAVGIDLGGTNARAALVDVAEGRLAGVEAKSPVEDRRPEAVADLLAALERRVDPRQEACGVGIGIAAMLRGTSGVVRRNVRSSSFHETHWSAAVMMSSATFFAAGYFLIFERARATCASL